MGEWTLYGMTSIQIRKLREWYDANYPDAPEKFHVGQASMEYRRIHRREPPIKDYIILPD